MLRWTGLALLLAGCGGAPEAAAPPAPVPVRVVAVGAAAGAPLAATGVVRFKRETPLAFVTPGRIARVAVREGDVVRGGQALAALESGPADAAAAGAGAELARARAELGRARTLRAQGWVTQGRVDTAQAAVRAAEAATAARGFDARFARLSAPAGGVVLRRLAEPGQTVAAGTPVLVVGEAPSGLVLRLPLTDSQVARVRIGQSATVRLPGLPPLAARVTEVAGRADERTGTFNVDLRLPAVAGVRSGLIGSAAIEAAPGGPGGEAAMLPVGALFAVRADEGFVWAVERGRVRPLMVRVGAVSNGGVLVEGVPAGARIVVGGLERLSPGAAVRVVR